MLPQSRKTSGQSNRAKEGTQQLLRLWFIWRQPSQADPELLVYAKQVRGRLGRLGCDTVVSEGIFLASVADANRSRRIAKQLGRIRAILAVENGSLVYEKLMALTVPNFVPTSWNRFPNALEIMTGKEWGYNGTSLVAGGEEDS